VIQRRGDFEDYISSRRRHGYSEDREAQSAEHARKALGAAPSGRAGGDSRSIRYTQNQGYMHCLPQICVILHPAPC